MKTISEILEELNIENGATYKMQVLKKYQDNELLKRVLKMAFCRVSFTYGITMKNIRYCSEGVYSTGYGFDLSTALDILENRFNTREVTGNEAITQLTYLLEHLSKEDANIIEKIINRDLRINLGRTSINKVFKDLIVKPPYERCDIGTKENVAKNIDFKKGVYSQVKMDGTYRSALLDAEIVTTGRSGIEDNFPVIKAQLETLNVTGYVLIGEMTLRGEKDRKKGNGLINSDNPPHEDIIYTVWDMVPVEEYRLKNGKTLYKDRLKMLEETIIDLDNVKIIEYRMIKSMQEAYEHFFEVTANGGEGTVIKAEDMTWKDGTSKKQLKVKLEIFLDLRCVGFTEGTKGTKRETTFGAMIYTSDDGKIQGQCSGFTDEELEKINSNREFYKGKVFEIKCNDITTSKSKDTYALSHANFQEFRDKDTTDTLERALELKQMAMELK